MKEFIAKKEREQQEAVANLDHQEGEIQLDQVRVLLVNDERVISHSILDSQDGEPSVEGSQMELDSGLDSIIDQEAELPFLEYIQKGEEGPSNATPIVQEGKTPSLELL